MISFHALFADIARRGSIFYFSKQLCETLALAPSPPRIYTHAAQAKGQVLHSSAGFRLKDVPSEAMVAPTTPAADGGGKCPW